MTAARIIETVAEFFGFLLFVGGFTALVLVAGGVL